MFIDNSISALVPVPKISKVGWTLYPRPRSIISTRTIFPSSTTGFKTARSARATPTNCKSISVSTATSYNREVAVGLTSSIERLLISRVSVIRFFIRTEFVRSINCFSASVRLINHPWRGLFKLPYRSLGDKLGLGTGRDCKSYPTKLSNHFLSVSTVGLLDASPSVRILY